MTEERSANMRESTVEKSLFGRVRTLVGRLKMAHVALALAAGMLALGASVGRFEAKSVQVEHDISEVKKETKERLDKVELDTGKRIDSMEGDVVRHLDELTNEQRTALQETARRMDKTQDILRDLASDVAVLCSKVQGKGCAHR